jgi:hypothetical protein
MKSKILFSKILFVLLLINYSSKSQIISTPYDIINNRACSIEVHWRIIDITAPCTPLCNGNNIVIAPFTTLSITCAIPFGSAIQVVLIGIGGSPVIPAGSVQDIGPIGACWGAGPISDSGLIPAAAQVPCLGTTWTMTYSGTSTTIN